MGGGYPVGRRSWNFYGSKTQAAAHVINAWEGPITFVGEDVGKKVLSGRPLIFDGPENDPVRMAMIYYSYTRPIRSWDPLTIMYAAYGLGDMFEFGNVRGYNRINADGSNEWVNEATDKHQHYLRLKISNEEAAAILDEKYLEAARKFAKRTPLRPPPPVVLRTEKKSES